MMLKSLQPVNLVPQGSGAVGPFSGIDNNVTEVSLFQLNCLHKPSLLNSISHFPHVHFIFFNILFIFREGKGGEREREKNINVWLPPAHPLLGTWPATEACALTGN